ncbi:MAG: ISL3 family transposase [Vulcanimicrobiaceae bacterium]
MTSSILNLSGYRVERVEETEHDYHVYAETIKPRFSCLCGASDYGLWGGHEQLVRDFPMHGKRVGIYVRTRRFRCNVCGKTAYESLPHISERRAMTTRLEKKVGEWSLKRTFASVAEEVGVDERSVRRIFQDHITDLEAEVRFEAPRWLGIDEIHIIKKPRAVISNVESRTIVNLLRDRNKRTVTAYLHALEGRDRVQYVAMDMWSPYREAVVAVLPQATVVVDKFHVVRMANVAMETVRKTIRRRLSDKQRRGLMHDRFLLLKREHELNAQQRFIVDTWAVQHPELGEAYRLKERFFSLYDAEDRHEAANSYATWVAAIPSELRAAFTPITTAFKTWHEPIFNYFDHPITNAYTESLNNLIRMMNRLGRGYSFEALRAKILFTEGLHKSEGGSVRPSFKRLQKRAASAGISAFALMHDEMTNMKAMPDRTPDLHSAHRERNMRVILPTGVGRRLAEELRAA